MIKIENVQVFNFEGALRGLRNPKNSWHLSDSYWEKDKYVIGEKDMHLSQLMIGAGTDESKFMRQIFVTMDITAPLYWWKEFDTYKVGTVANSCSTMHKLDSMEIIEEMFSTDSVDLTLPLIDSNDANDIGWLWKDIVFYCEQLRKKYKETGNKDYWRALVQILPNGWLQKRTVTLNYQVLRAMYFARRFHKLIEWHIFCKAIEELPYGLELICYVKPTKDYTEDIIKLIKAFCEYKGIEEPEDKDILKFIETQKEKKNERRKQSNRVSSTRDWFRKFRGKSN